MAEGSPAAPASVNEKRGRTKAIDGTLLVEEEPGDVIIREGLAELVKVSQLPDIRVQRLNEMDIKPVEELTFEDIRNYSRDQLRAYCYVYGVLRKKKFEMELDMARYASYFHPNDPEYDISKYVPKEKRGDNDGDSPHANPSDPLIREPSQQQQDAATPQLDPSVQFRIPEQVGGQEQGGFKRPATIQIGQFRQHLRQSQEQRRLFDEQQKAVWEREHMQLQQAAEKFKLSFSSEESMTSKMVDDAAAFYRGHDTEEAIEDKAISWDRITRNNGILKEIFDGAEPKEQALVVEADMKSVREKMGIEKDEVGSQP
uniref:Uncharacterized protein n=2 Tax=Rhodosorus marinus TaxID=101924 RepID=A0A7S2ZIC3_9RHOD|mmetsp:Transcript_20660/g.83866  ORF Transcript_20660/g.83866 Transcript_20660/m.83866 type:complete len:314 (+) Transcript_20660:130-1071(+)